MNSTASGASEMAMKGGGYYSLSTKGAKDVIDAATPLVLDALARMDPAATEAPFVLADMGCADGGTSIDMVRAVVAALRERAPDRPVSVVYTDQLRNDYNALFQTVHGPMGLAPAGVHVFASATGFYDQILPAGTLDLGFSATAMHWLSRKPGDISNHVQAVRAEGAELTAFADQARRDWDAILLHRAGELRPGGRMVMANFCEDEDGRYLGNTDGVHMFDTFNEIWQGFVGDGVIDRSEYAAMTLPQYYKTVAEFRAPFADPGSPVHRVGLRLEHIETRVTSCPYAADFMAHRDATQFANTYIPTLRSWTESSFFAGCPPSGRWRNVRRSSEVTMTPTRSGCVIHRRGTPWTMSMPS